MTERQIRLTALEPRLELACIQRHRADANNGCDMSQARDQGWQEPDHADIGQQQAEHFRKLIDPQKTMHAPDLDAAIIDDDKGGQHLAYEFLHRGDDQDIIFQAQEEYDKRGSYKILKIRVLIKSYRKEATKDETGEDPQSPQRSDR